MKHLFTIHSPLTFLMAYTIVEQLKLPLKDVILISTRYQVPVDGFRVEASFHDLYAKWYQKLLNFNLPNSYDRYIDRLTDGEPFTAYVDLMSYYQKILVTHERCRAFHFMEEGNSAYQAEDNLMDLTWADRKHDYRVRGIADRGFRTALLRVIRGYNLRLLSVPYHYLAYSTFQGLKYYSFSNNAFYNAPPEKKVTLSPDPDRAEMLQMALNIRLKEEVIWIDGSNGRYTGLPESFYHRAIEAAIDSLVKKGWLKDKLYVKLRPGIKDIRSNHLVRILQDRKFQVEVLPDGLVLESLFITSNNCVVVGTLTAALEYAHVFGHRAYSIYGLFEEQPPTFFDRMTGFWKNVELLD